MVDVEALLERAVDYVLRAASTRDLEQRDFLLAHANELVRLAEVAVNFRTIQLRGLPAA